MRWTSLFILILLAGCSGGAVVFAPTPAPADVSPLRYEHPSGAFGVTVPRLWPVFSQNATTLASASFSAPGGGSPLMTFAVVNLGESIDSGRFGELINEYQTNIRPDVTRYKEENREAMGDGSWRLSGLRTGSGGDTQQINSFIERAGSYLAVIEVVVPDDPQRQTDIQNAINSFELRPEASLEASDFSVLVSLAVSNLELVNIASWTSDQGVFYITGEVANHSPETIVDLPLRANLKLENGQVIAEALDTPMGYGLPPGGFAPFSLRFGQGQPAQTVGYELVLGGADWQPANDRAFYGPGNLEWIDDSSIDENGHLIITGTMTNIGSQMLRSPRATATVFDAQQRVIGARFVDLQGEELGPNESLDFRIVLEELGGSPAQYVVNIQALG